MIERHVALLRGVNVGGHQRIPMAQLRALLSGLGFDEVQTYLQSGNAVFSSTAAADVVATQIEEALAAELALHCRVIVRTAPQLSAVMTADPLLHLLGNPSRHLVGFLSDAPVPAGVSRLSKQDFGIAELRIVDAHLYLWCPNGLTASPFAKMDFDRILGAAVTIRNWNTVTKLSELARG